MNNHQEKIKNALATLSEELGLDIVELRESIHETTTQPTIEAIAQKHKEKFISGFEATPKSDCEENRNNFLVKCIKELINAYSFLTNHEIAKIMNEVFKGNKNEIKVETKNQTRFVINIGGYGMNRDI